MMLSTNQQSSTKNLSEQSRKVLAIRDDVFAEWEKRVRSLIHGADEVSHPVLLDTLPLFSSLTHDMRSPLSVIISGAELLLATNPGKSDKIA